MHSAPCPFHLRRLATKYQLVFGGKPTRPMPMQSASVFSPAAWMPWTASSSSRSSVSPVTPTAPMTSPPESHRRLLESSDRARGNEIAHEDRPLLRALANEFRAAAER